MIKVAHVITSLNAGGAEAMLCKLLSRIDRRRFENSVVAMIPGGRLRERVPSDVPVVELGMRRGVPNAAALWRLVSLLRKIRPHVVQTWLYHADLLGLIAAKIVGLPVVWNIRRSSVEQRYYSIRGNMLLHILPRLSSLPAAVVVNSAAGQQSHEMLGYRRAKWKLIPNGFDLAEFHSDPKARVRMREELGIAPEVLLVGHVARFAPEKDHLTFLRAAAEIAQKLPGVHYLMAGRGVIRENTDLATEVKNLGLGRQVHMLGERADVANVLAALDVFCLSSWGEGFANVVGEAMSCGVPCVVTDVGECASLVADTGRVVPARSPQAIAEACLEMLSEPLLRVRLGATARKRVEQQFSLESVTSDYQTLYEELLKGAVRQACVS